MRIAALYDIHSNLPALDAVLADLRTLAVDLIVVGGDVVPGPMPGETLEALRSLDLPVRFLRGNGEREVLAMLDGHPPATVPERFHDLLRWVGAQLTPAQRQHMATWPPTLRLDLPGLGPVLFCHATPRSDTEVVTRRTPAERLRPIFDAAGAPLVICGHTHMPFDRTVGATRIVNAGSVGMPFGAPGAAWLLLDSDITVRHTTYDLHAAADRIRATSYPDAAGFADHHVLAPPSEATMLDALERQAPS